MFCFKPHWITMSLLTMHLFWLLHTINVLNLQHALILVVLLKFVADRIQPSFYHHLASMSKTFYRWACAKYIDFVKNFEFYFVIFSMKIQHSPVNHCSSKWTLLFAIDFQSVGFMSNWNGMWIWLGYIKRGSIESIDITHVNRCITAKWWSTTA